MDHQEIEQEISQEFSVDPAGKIADGIGEVHDDGRSKRTGIVPCTLSLLLHVKISKAHNACNTTTFDLFSWTACYFNG